ncbi:OmpA family protein [Microvirgula aerodenitrificans]|uniref:OmpA family protein n=1 Tax=Microvirgula aerodenitrificans TaxID=57480 RepID=UPI00248EA780|nr:OmpA family protein [Microvirgula aerodenitrificans]
MTINLLGTLTQALDGHFADMAATAVADTQGSTRRAIDAVVPVLLGGLVQLGTGPAGAAAVIDLLQRTDPGPGTSELPQGIDTGTLMTTGRTLLSSLFGERLGTITEALAARHSLATSTVGGVLALAAPLLSGKLKALIAERQLDAAGLGQLLAEQKPSLAGALPAGLPGLLGLDGLTASAGTTAADASERIHAIAPDLPPDSPPPTLLRRWLPWIIVLLVLLMALTQLRQCGTGTTAIGIVPPPAAPAPAPAQPPAAPASTMPQAAARPAPVRLYFDVASVSVPDDSELQLQAVIDYATAHPDARIAISGFHDKTGNSDRNAALARDRAKSVKAVLVLAGIAEERIDLEKPLESTGYTSDREARRVEVTVR